MFKRACSLFLLLIFSLSTLHAPFAYALTPASESPGSKNLRKELLKYAYTISSLRTEIPLVPIPAVAVAKIDLSGIQATLLVLVFPAHEGAKTDTLEIIKGFIGEFLKRAGRESFDTEESIGKLAAQLYLSVYNTLIEKAGVKPAFLPNENMSFTVVVVLWTRTESIFEYISTAGLDKLQEVSSNIIYLAANFISENTIGKLREAVKNTIQEEFSKLRLAVQQQLNSYFSSTENMVRSLDCQNIIVDNKTYYQAGLEININAYISKNTHISINVGDEITYTYSQDLNVKKVNENLSKELENAMKDILSKVDCSNDKCSESLFYVNSNQLNDISNQVRLHVEDKLDSAFSKISEKYSLSNNLSSGLHQSCDNAKNRLIEQLNSIKEEVTRKITEKINYVEQKILSSVNAAFDEIEGYLRSIVNEIDSSFREGLGVIGEKIGSSLEQAATAAMSKMPLALVAYAFAEGIFATVQSMVNKIILETRINSVENLDESFLILTQKMESFSVRTPKGEEKFDFPAETSLSEKLWSAAKGFAAGFVGALASTIGLGKPVRDAFSYIPSVFVVNISFKKQQGEENEVIIAPTKPGLYTLDAEVTAQTVLSSFNNIVNSINKFIFPSTSRNKENDFSKRIYENLIGNKIVKIEDSSIRNSAEVKIPFLVLTPYFIVNKVMISDGIVEINFSAIYDFSSVFTSNSNNLKETLISSLNNVIDFISSKVIDTLFNTVFDEAKSYSIFLESVKKTLKDYLSERLREVVFSGVSQFVPKDLLTFLDVNAPGSEYDYYLRHLLTTSLSVFAVRVVNSGRSGLVVYLPSINVLSSTTLNDRGYVLVRFPQILLQADDIDSLGAVPLYRREAHGEVTFFKVPWAAESLEPLVSPLIPVPMIQSDYLAVRFVTLFSKGIKESCRLSAKLEFLGDNAILSTIDARDGSQEFKVSLNNAKQVKTLMLKVRSVSITRSAPGKGGLFVPVLSSAEKPLLVNPSNA